VQQNYKLSYESQLQQDYLRLHTLRTLHAACCCMHRLTTIKKRVRERAAAVAQAVREFAVLPPMTGVRGLISG
jgi:hypothetical protein